MGILRRDIRMNGKVLLNGNDLYKQPPKERRELCGTTLGFIPQIPMTAFDPRLSLGHQMCETFRYKLRCSRKDADALSNACLLQVNLTDAERILRSRPSGLSGGMLQRVAFAFQLGLSPEYILADEPTSALDGENSDILLGLLEQQKKTAGILFVSHDYHALERICDQVVILQDGESVLYDSFEEVVHHPQQEWAKQFVDYHRIPEKGDFRWMAS